MAHTEVHKLGRKIDRHRSRLKKHETRLRAHPGDRDAIEGAAIQRAIIKNLERLREEARRKGAHDGDPHQGATGQ